MGTGLPSFQDALNPTVTELPSATVPLREALYQIVDR